MHNRCAVCTGRLTFAGIRSTARRPTERWDECIDCHLYTVSDGNGSIIAMRKSDPGKAYFGTVSR